MEKENVYEENEQTGAVACVTGQAEEDCEAKSVPTVLGKFKDVDALVRAYEALQAEFTRRSQKLKKLEKQLENFTAEGDKHEKCAENGAEKLRKNAAQRKAENKKFDLFVSELEEANARAEKHADFEAVEPDCDVSLAYADAVDAAEVMGVKAESQKQSVDLPIVMMQDTQAQTERSEMGEGVVAGNEKGEVLSSEQLFEKARGDESVRLRIIGEYLSSIGKTAVPLMQGGASAAATPPLKPKSVHEAGTMALRFFKKEGAQA